MYVYDFSYANSHSSMRVCCGYFDFFLYFYYLVCIFFFFFFFQAEDGIRDGTVTGVRRVLFRSSPAPRRVRPAGATHGRRRAGTAHPPAVPARPHPPDLTGRGTASADPGYAAPRSEERRVGKECRSRGSPEHERKKGRTSSTDR